MQPITHHSQATHNHLSSNKSKSKSKSDPYLNRRDIPPRIAAFTLAFATSLNTLENRMDALETMLCRGRPETSTIDTFTARRVEKLGLRRSSEGGYSDLDLVVLGNHGTDDEGEEKAQDGDSPCYYQDEDLCEGLRFEVREKYTGDMAAACGDGRRSRDESIELRDSLLVVTECGSILGRQPLEILTGPPRKVPSSFPSDSTTALNSDNRRKCATILEELIRNPKMRCNIDTTLVATTFQNIPYPTHLSSSSRSMNSQRPPKATQPKSKQSAPIPDIHLISSSQSSSSSSRFVPTTLEKSKPLRKCTPLRDETQIQAGLIRSISSGTMTSSSSDDTKFFDNSSAWSSTSSISTTESAMDERTVDNERGEDSKTVSARYSVD